MTDKEFIEHIAKEWIRLGGDADGVAYCWRDLQEAVRTQQGLNEEDAT